MLSQARTRGRQGAQVGAVKAALRGMVTVVGLDQAQEGLQVSAEVWAAVVVHVLCRVRVILKGLLRPAASA